jgi:hypothetical protein
LWGASEVQAGFLDLETIRVVRTFAGLKAPQEVLIRPEGMALAAPRR